MPTYTLELELLGTYLTDMPGFEIWADGVKLGPTYSISSSGSSISTNFTYGGALPSSLEFRFTDASGETPRTIEVQSVKINDRYVNTGNFLSSDNLTNGQTSTVDIVGATDVFDQNYEPPASEFTIGATATFTASFDFYRKISGTADAIFDMLDGNDYAHTAGGDDKIAGGAGDDFVRAGDGNDLIFGGADNDRLFGQGDDDEIYGGSGNDRLFGNDGDDEVHGGTGDDKVNGNNGNDFLTGGDGDDLLNAGSGDDIVFGDAGVDTLIGGAGDDTLDGGDGDDVIYGGAGADQINGGDDDDILIGNGDNDIISGDAGNDQINGGLGDDTLRGGEGNDFITGEDGNDNIDGGIGLDILVGGAGVDTINGGDGNDIIHGHGLNVTQIRTVLNANADVFYNSQTNSFYQFVTTTANWTSARAIANGTLINGVQGHLVNITTQAENDLIESVTGTDIISIGASDAALEGEWGWVDGAEAGLQFWSGGTGGSIVNNAYNNWRSGSEPNNSGGNEDFAEIRTGDTWNDIGGSANVRYVIEWDAGLMLDDNANDILNGGSGQDTIYGYGGDDVIFAGDGNDTIFGGDGDDNIRGEGNFDYINGGNGNDLLDGDGGDDTILGGNGDDTILGNIGNDILTGGAGLDNIDAGLDDDIINLANGDFVAGEVLNGNLGADQLILTNATTVDLSIGTVTLIEDLIGSSGNDDVTYTIQQALSFDSIDLGGGTDNSRVQANGVQDVTGLGLPTVTNAENGFLTGSTGDDDLTITGAQLDSLIYGAGIINFDSGNDIVRITSAHSSNLNTLAADDTLITGLETVDTTAISLAFTLDLTAQTEDFIITTGNGQDVITGGSGDDTISGNIGNDDLFGGIGNDTINGGQGFDDIYGGAGADIIDAGTENDRIYGGGTEFLGDTIDGSVGTDDAFYLQSDTTFDSTVSFTNMERIVFNNGGAWEINVTSNDSVDFTGLVVSGISIIRGDVGDETIRGTEASDQIFGGDNLVRDTLFGNGGNDQIFGEDGNDYIFGGDGNDIMDGGAGTDALHYGNYFSSVNINVATGTATGEGNDTFSNFETYVGSRVDDIITGSAAGESLLGYTGADIINAGDGDDTLYGWVGGGADETLDGGDTLNGENGNDTIFGGYGDDTIRGGFGVDIMNGENGNDILDASDGDEADTIDGGADNDTVTYSSAAGGVFVDLAITTGQDTQGAGVDTISNVENATGSGFNDALDGDAGNNILTGLAGDDEIEGHGGNDIMDGGAGVDVVTYESAGSAVTVDLSIVTAQSTLGAGTDTISNFENLTGSDFNDTLTGDTGDNIIAGLDGNDTIDGGDGNDTILGGNGNDTLTGGDGDDTIYGATIIGQSGVESVIQTSSAQWHSVTFAATIVNPVIKMSNMTNNDGDFYTVRVRSVTDSGFEYQIDEWDYLDGSRILAEEVSWLAIAEGTHTLDNGSVVQAGLTTATNEDFTTVTFDSAFGSAPVVMSQVMTDNEASAVASRNRNRTATGFQLQMQEEEANANVHATETIGWIAIDNGGSAASGFLIGETGDVVTHNVTTVNFGGSGFANTPVVLHDQETRDGGDTSYSQADGITTTEGRFFIGEEQSANAEVNHTTEVVGYYALNEGLLSAAGGGDNTITGGDGLDTLYGGDGADTFIFEAVSAYADLDVLADFSAGEGDILDISDLITLGTVNAGNVADYINFDDSSGTHTIVQIDGNRTVGGVNFQDIGRIEGITGLDEVTLFNNGNILA